MEISALCFGGNMQTKHTTACFLQKRYPSLTIYFKSQAQAMPENGISSHLENRFLKYKVQKARVSNVKKEFHTF